MKKNIRGSDEKTLSYISTIAADEQTFLLINIMDFIAYHWYPSKKKNKVGTKAHATR